MTDYRPLIEAAADRSVALVQVTSITSMTMAIPTQTLRAMGWPGPGPAGDKWLATRTDDDRWLHALYHLMQDAIGTDTRRAADAMPQAELHIAATTPDDTLQVDPYADRALVANLTLTQPGDS